MKTVSIVCEFNPFHNGHAYILRELREKCNADYIVAIMSGNYVQRGEPAIYDKYTRARMALIGDGGAGHADLVLEMPTVFSTAAAGDFAFAGVSMALFTAVTDVLGFGIEEGATLSDIRAQAELMDMIENEAEEHDGASAFAGLHGKSVIMNDAGGQKELRRLLRSGMSYPEAVSVYLETIRTQLAYGCAALDCTGARSQHSRSGSEKNSIDNIGSVNLSRNDNGSDKNNAEKIEADQACSAKVSQDYNSLEKTVNSNIYASNNILACEYLRALKKLDRNGSVRAYAVQRQGDSYASTVPADEYYCSASALRNMIFGESAKHDICDGISNELIDRSLVQKRADAAAQQSVYAHGKPGAGITTDVHGISSRCKTSAFVPDRIGNYIPEALQETYAFAQQAGAIHPDAFSEILNKELLMARYRGSSLTDYADVSREIADRLINRADRPLSFTERIADTKTRQYTYTRISRALMHIAAGVTREETAAFKAAGCVRYIKVLGFRREATPLIRAIKANAAFPVITRNADYRELLNEEIYHSGIYYAAAGARSELERSPVVL